MASKSGPAGAILSICLGVAACFVDAAPTTSGGTSGPSTGATSSTGDAEGSSTGATSSDSDAPPICGDGHEDPGEECDLGPANGANAACRGDCTRNTCGDGDLGPEEACDDGNLDDGDGCSATCESEDALDKRLAFVTLGKANGNIGGLANADAKCQSEAESHGLPGTYFAWLSAGVAESPATRFAPHELPIVLPGDDGPMVALGTAGLLSDQHLGPIDRGPDGSTLPPTDNCAVDGMVWTGTQPAGKPHADTCQGFTNGDSGTLGAAGRYTELGAAWSAECSIECSVSLRLYCLQQ